MKLAGSCHCGAVTFEAEAPPVRMAQCHCTACRKATGTGHIVQAFFKREAVTISGETTGHESPADSGSLRTRHFCPTCGSRLFAENDKNPAVIGIAVGAFENSEWFKPEVILYNDERPIWDTIDTEIPLHDKM